MPRIDPVVDCADAIVASPRARTASPDTSQPQELLSLVIGSSNVAVVDVA
jgi:hypothetical protein